MTRSWVRIRLVAMFSAVVLATVSCGGNQTAFFPGTDVKFLPGSASGGGSADAGMCMDYARTLDAFVKVADAVVVGTVAAETPVFEEVYGTVAPIFGLGFLVGGMSYSPRRS